MLFRSAKDQHFYKIKNKILLKYSTFISYDTQFIEGKKCFSCNGTGLHEHYDYDDDESYFEACYNCHSGWYKLPTWNILKKVKFGKYIFYQPYQRMYKKPDISSILINGYIKHEKSKYSKFALIILFLFFDKEYISRLYRIYIKYKIEIKFRNFRNKFKNNIDKDDDLPF